MEGAWIGPEKRRRRSVCGRYSLVTPAEKWAQFFDVNPDSALLDPPRYNIAPGQPVVAVRSAKEPFSTREVVKLRWGLVPGWAKDPKIGHRLVNARAESLAEKPAFESALRRRRCLIVADGFYEWSGPAGRRRPHYVHRRDGAPFAIAGLWERWRGPASDTPASGTPIETCTLVTTKANGTLCALHDRMPALLDPSEYAAWLGRPGQEAEPAALAPLLRPCPDDWLLVHEVGMHVNDARFDAPECIAPLRTGALVS
jgi:putative SOS response-associated peptidase YedK